MKLLFLLHLPPPFYGVTKINKDILGAGALKRFLVDVVAVNTAKTQQSVGKNTPAKLIVFLSIFFTLLKRLTFNKYKLCYFSLTPTGAAFYKDFILALLVKAFKVKMLYHLHGKGIASQRGWIKEFFYRTVFKDSKVIVMSESLFSDVKKYVNRDKVYVLPNGIKPAVDDDFFERISKSRASLKTVKLLLLSNITKSKGVYIALEAAKILKEKEYDFKLYFAGNWFDISKEEFMRKVKSLGIGDKVEYLGFREGQGKKSLLADSDIFVYPTLNDAFPLVVLEAMHFGLPIIASREGAISDIIEDGVSGFLVPKKDTDALVQKVELLINNADLRLKIGKAARQKSLSEYTFDKFEKRLVKIFDETINS